MPQKKLQQVGYAPLSLDEINKLKSKKYPFSYSVIYGFQVLIYVFSLFLSGFIFFYFDPVSRLGNTFLLSCFYNDLNFVYFIVALMTPLVMTLVMLLGTYLVIKFGSTQFNEFYLLKWHIKARLPYPLEVDFLIAKNPLIIYSLFIFVVILLMATYCAL